MIINLQSIGYFETPFKQPEGTPLQPSASKNIEGKIYIQKKFAKGLKDLEEFSHLIAIYYLHKITKSKLIVKPIMDNQTHGIFSTRAPVRPNPIGLSVLKILSIQGNIINVEGVDMINKTPLIDIKPYVPNFKMEE